MGVDPRVDRGHVLLLFLGGGDSLSFVPLLFQERHFLVLMHYFNSNRI